MCRNIPFAGCVGLVTLAGQVEMAEVHARGLGTPSWGSPGGRAGSGWPLAGRFGGVWHLCLPVGPAGARVSVAWHTLHQGHRWNRWSCGRCWQAIAQGTLCPSCLGKMAGAGVDTVQGFPGTCYTGTPWWDCWGWGGWGGHPGGTAGVDMGWGPGVAVAALAGGSEHLDPAPVCTVKVKGNVSNGACC